MGDGAERAGTRAPVAPRQLAPVAAASAGTTVWLAALGLVTTPYMLHRLGASAYAVFALITIMTAYLSNLELGFGQATLRFLARAHARGDDLAQTRILGTSLCVFGAAALVGAAVTVAAAPTIVRSFADFPADLDDEAVDAVRLGGLLLIVTVLFSLASVSLQAMGRFRFLLWSRLAAGTLLSASAVAMAAIFQDVRAVLAGQVVISLASCVVGYVALNRATREPLRPVLHLPTFREMRGYAALILATGVAYQAMLQGPPTVLAGAAEAAEVAAFAVPAIVLQQLTLLVAAASTGFLPFASAQSGENDPARLGAVFRSHLRLTLITMGTIAAFLVVFADPILATWVSEDFADRGAGALRWLALAGLLLAVGAPASDVARGLGHPGWTLMYAAGAAAVGVTAAVLLAGELEATGTALALFLGVAVTTVPFVLAVAGRLLGLSAIAMGRAVRAPAAAVLAAAAGFWLGSLLLADLPGALVAGAVVTPALLVLVHRLVLEDVERAALAAGADRIRRRAPAGRG